MIRVFAVLIPTVFVVSALVISAPAAADQPPWLDSLSKARQAAKQSGKLVLIHFEMDHCAPCVRMERLVFSQAQVWQELTRSFVPVKFNVSQSRTVADKFGVNRFPADIVITPAGKVLHRSSGSKGAEQYVAALNQVAAKHLPSPASRFASNAEARTPQGRFVSEDSRQPVGDNSRFAAPPYDSGARNDAPPPAAPEPSGNMFGGGNAPVVDNPPAAQIERRPHGRVAYLGNGPRQPGAEPHPNSPQFDPRGRAPLGGIAPPSAAPRQTATAAQPNRYPIALEGHCPVSLLRDSVWQKGDPRYGAVHRGRTYLFAGPAEQQLFLSNLAMSDRYSPVLSGYDPVEFVERGRLSAGSRQHGLIHEGRIYLFVSEESLQRFDANPKPYAEPAQQAMRAAAAASR